MAINPETLRLTSELRVTLDALVDAETRRIVGSWARAFDQIRADWVTAADDLAALYTTGQPTAAQIARLERVTRALEVTARQLDRLAVAADIGIVNAAGDAVELSRLYGPRVIASQLPATAGTTASLAVAFDRLDPGTLTSIVARSGQQITSMMIPLSAEATAAVRRSLISGIATGANPREVARQILRRTEGAFNGGLTRALNIARTEILDAHRQGSYSANQLNADVLTGWRWTATLSERTCPSCLAQHGRLYPITEPGPLDHQQGRCTGIPVTKPWSELGFGVEEPPSAFPDRDVWIDTLDNDQLAQILGPARFKAMLRGDIGWDDLTVRVSTDGWRDSYRVPPLKTS